MSLIEKAKYLLRKNHIHPKRSFGQNFMIESTFFRSMTDHMPLDKNDVALDVGAGLGFLTRFLADKCRRVLAVENDKIITRVLREQIADLSNVEVIEGNILKTLVPSFNKIVSIPPYNISSRLLPWLFNRKFDSAAFILQKEFAERLTARVGSEDYGWLTVLTYYYTEVEFLEKVPKSAFYPQPKVDSIILRLTPRKPKPFRLKDETSFEHLVRSLFTQRNRKVRNAIPPCVKGARPQSREEVTRNAEILPFNNLRVRELTPEEFGVIANAAVD